MFYYIISFLKGVSYLCAKDYFHLLTFEKIIYTLFYFSNTKTLRLKDSKSSKSKLLSIYFFACFYSGAFNTKATRKNQGTQSLILKVRYNSGGFKTMTIIDFTRNTKKKGT